MSALAASSAHVVSAPVVSPARALSRSTVSPARAPGALVVSSLDAVLNHPAVWRGGECARVACGISTGYAELDAELPGSGWPTTAITEIYAERTGVGEVELTMPAAARLTQAGRWVTLVAPLHVPYAPALAAHGVRLERLLLVETRSVEDNLWACERRCEHPRVARCCCGRTASTSARCAASSSPPKPGPPRFFFSARRASPRLPRRR